MKLVSEAKQHQLATNQVLACENLFALVGTSAHRTSLRGGQWVYSDLKCLQSEYAELFVTTPVDFSTC